MDITTIAKTVRRWQERSRARRALHGMSDRELADIGLTRIGIEAALRGDSTAARSSGSHAGR